VLPLVANSPEKPPQSAVDTVVKAYVAQLSDGAEGSNEYTFVEVSKSEYTLVKAGHWRVKAAFTMHVSNFSIDGFEPYTQHSFLSFDLLKNEAGAWQAPAETIRMTKE
jgi:hypothetical protein